MEAARGREALVLFVPLDGAEAVPELRDDLVRRLAVGDAGGGAGNNPGALDGLSPYLYNGAGNNSGIWDGLLPSLYMAGWEVQARRCFW